MSFLAAAVGGGALIGAGASIYGANKQSDAANAALDFQKQAYGQGAPYRDLGRSATSYLDRLNSGDMSKFYTSPDYTFRLNQGLSTLQNSAAARGGLLSGNAMRAITDYGQNTASSEFGNYWNRMFNQSQLGAGAASNAGTQAGQIGNTMMGVGQAQASGAVGAANSINGGIQNYAFLDAYKNRGTGSAYTPTGYLPSGGVPTPQPNPWA